MYTKEESMVKIKELTESFEAKLDFIKTSKEYKEAQIEDEFIKPLFKYLNWNISNEGIINPHEREFIVQAQGRNRKEPDYLLQLENKRRFYIEAKHTKYDLRIRTDYIWQAYSYSYSTQTRPKYEKVDFALLTDFEEFRFFDCTFPVKNHETLNNYCVLDWTFKDYIKNFDKLWEYFERENVRNGSLEQLYISEKKIKENRIPPDKAFLKDLDDEKSGWRIKLAKDVKKYHPEFSAEFITQTVQLILDRFIFIKVLVDREIEEDYIEKIVNKIKGIKDKDEGIIYEECKEIFEQLDKTYNGSIFTKRTELDFVVVSNKVLLDVLKDFLPQNSRYNFKVIPIEILGTIYEQFLGKVVVTTAKQAKIDYKPEVRKAGGVYYTPDYIVNYIVEKTVGEKLKECKKFVDLLQIKICDPACGSGSFLISAYNALIQWTIKYYNGKIKTENGISKLEKLTKDEKTLVYLDGDGNIRLTSKIKRDILKSCIYGVDIDPQAVEVTKMSLSLKALENTNHYEIYSERTLFHTTILPPLEGNIKCGNSIIKMDIYDNELELTEQQVNEREKLENKIKPLDYEIAFKDIFKFGGFDCLVMNPPWGYDFSELELSYLRNKNKEIIVRMIDSFMYFVYQSEQKIKNNAYIGMIVPDVISYQVDNNKLRKFLLDNFTITNIINVGNVFEQVVRPSTILITKKSKTTENKISINDFTHLKDQEAKKITLKNPDTFNFVKQNLINSMDGFIFITKNIEQYKILNKINNLDVKSLEYYIDPDGIQRGVSPDLKKAFIVNSDIIKKYNLEKSKLRKVLTGGKQVKRYYIIHQNMWLIYTNNKDDFSKIPNIKNYINQYKHEIKCIEVKQKKHSMYALHRARDEKIFLKKEKFLGVITEDEIVLTIDKEQIYATDGLYLFSINENINPYTLLGILNSKLYVFIYRLLSLEKGRTLAQVKPSVLTKLPLINITSNNLEICNQISSLAKSISDEYLKMNTIISENDRERIKNKIDVFINKLDYLVYQLYELSSEEIEIIEKEN